MAWRHSASFPGSSLFGKIVEPRGAAGLPGVLHPGGDLVQDLDAKSSLGTGQHGGAEKHCEQVSFVVRERRR